MWKRGVPGPLVSLKTLTMNPNTTTHNRKPMTPTPNRMAPTSEAPENQLALNSRTIPAKTNRSSGIDFPLVVTYTSSSSRTLRTLITSLPHRTALRESRSQRLQTRGRGSTGGNPAAPTNPASGHQVQGLSPKLVSLSIPAKGVEKGSASGGSACRAGLRPSLLGCGPGYLRALLGRDPRST